MSATYSSPDRWTLRRKWPKTPTGSWCKIPEIDDENGPITDPVTANCAENPEAECLKEVKKLKSTCTVKILTASKKIAKRMGKNEYFARQIRANEEYLHCHHHIPPPKQHLKGWWTLLENQYFTDGARVSCSLNLLCKHANKVILPTPQLITKKASICEHTASCWLKIRVWG